MPSSFDTLFRDKAVPVLSQHLGEDSAVYMPDDSGLRDVPLQNAIICDESEEEFVTDDGIRSRRVRMMTLFTDTSRPEFCGVESPVLNAGVAIGESLYVIISVLHCTGGCVDVKLHAVGQRELSMPRFRRDKQ